MSIQHLAQSPTSKSAKHKELEIEEELAKIKLARLKLRYFIDYCYPPYEHAKHHALLCEELEQIERYVATEGKEGNGRLVVTMPPRHGKSLHVSWFFPAWFLGRNPEKRVMICSHGAELAEGFSGKVRNLVEVTEYKKLFGDMATKDAIPAPVRVDEQTRSKQAWDIGGHYGGVFAAGVGVPITGRGADVLIIDDPIKNREEADSDKVRESIKDWFTSTAYTRLQPGGAVIIMMTRWHEDDLIGWVLSEKNEEKNWKLLNLPAIAEDGDAFRQPGEALWPDWWSAERLEKEYKTLLPPRDWNAMFQQRPSSEEGDVFLKDWFVYDSLPEKDEITYALQVWDCALTEKDEGDYSAGVTMFVTRSGVFVADIVRGHWNFPTLKAKMFEQYELWSRHFRISRVCIENRVAGQSMVQSLRKESSLPIIPMEPESRLGRSKRLRAEAVAGYVQSGRVIFRKGAAWLHDFEHEMLSFPHGKHDDMVDAFVYGLIQTQGGGRGGRSVINKRRESMGWNNQHKDRLSALAGGI